MKQLLLILVTLTAAVFCTASCSKNDAEVLTQHNGNINVDTTHQTKSKMKITVGASIFTATLNDNATVSTFKAMLLLTITMSELNANEKFFYFSSTLPTNATRGGNIEAGDLMLYGNNCLVLFYEGLNTSYNYTRLGSIDNINGLKAALGTGDITVKFELQ